MLRPQDPVSITPKVETLQLWTIKSLAAWKAFESGDFQVTPERIDPVFVKAYDWLIEKMCERIGPPPIGVRYPVWAWYQYNGEQQQRPDLRARGHLAKGEEGVRVSLSIPKDRVLLSDFTLWGSLVVNDVYIGASESDEIIFEERLKAAGIKEFRSSEISDTEVRQKIIDSWDRIFDLDSDNSYYVGSRATRAIQATFWRIEPEYVGKVERFRAR